MTFHMHCSLQPLQWSDHKLCEVRPKFGRCPSQFFSIPGSAKISTSKTAVLRFKSRKSARCRDPFFFCPETVVVLKYEQKKFMKRGNLMEFAEILKYAQKVPILVFGIGIRLNLSVLELLELFGKKSEQKFQWCGF